MKQEQLHAVWEARSRFTQGHAPSSGIHGRFEPFIAGLRLPSFDRLLGDVASVEAVSDAIGGAEMAWKHSNLRFWLAGRFRSVRSATAVPCSSGALPPPALSTASDSSPPSSGGVLAASRACSTSVLVFFGAAVFLPARPARVAFGLII